MQVALTFFLHPFESLNGNNATAAERPGYQKFRTNASRQFLLTLLLKISTKNWTFALVTLPESISP